MKYLLDVNVLLALAHQNHSEHLKVSNWFRDAYGIAKVFLTCSITELGFVRVSVQAGLEANIIEAMETLRELKKSSKVSFTILADDIGCDRVPSYVKLPSSLTDGHLLDLANKVGAKLVTLDKGIPGALLVT